MSQFFTGKFIKVQFLLSGNVHPTPGPVDDSFRLRCWDLNRVCALNKIRIPLTEAYNSIFHYDVITLSETYVNESIKDEDIWIDDYSTEVFRSNHPSGKKRVGVVYTLKRASHKARKDLKFTQETVICKETVICQIHSGVKSIFHRDVSFSKPK